MIEQASVRQLRSGEITRKDGYVVVAMRYYPRGLRKELRDEYRADLAPDRELFKDFKRWQAAAGHREAFQRSRYFERFALQPEAIERLRRLAELGRTRKVYLVCQCEVGEPCHRELLMLLARRRFGAEIGRVHHSYRGARVLE